MASEHWKPYVPTDSTPWDQRRAIHLYRRAAFGATWEEIGRSLEDGPHESVTRLLDGRSRINGLRADFEDLSQLIGDAAVSGNDANRLKAWWLFRMLFGPDALQEKLTLSWHTHFATSQLKVKNLFLMRVQNEVFRAKAMRPFGELLQGVLHDPALLIWLDADSNRFGRPNENLARELMELFTLGIGNYSEADVKETARALTGWTVQSGRPHFRSDRYDDGVKTILGKTGPFDVDRLTQLLLENDATSQRITWRLCETFMGENVVSKEALNELAAELKQHNLDIAWGVEKILRSDLFFCDANIRSRVSSPIEFALTTIRALEMLDDPPSTTILADWCQQMGQDLFYPPNVGGWTGGRSWLTSRTIVARSNFAAALVSGHMQAPSNPPAMEEVVSRHRKDKAMDSANAFFETLLLGEQVSDAQELVTSDGIQFGDFVARLLSRPEAYLI